MHYFATNLPLLQVQRQRAQYQTGLAVDLQILCVAPGELREVEKDRLVPLTAGDESV